MTTIRQMTEAEMEELIAEEFGVNADYVSELLVQYTRNPHSVAEEWRGYFAELLSNGHAPAEHAGNGARPAPSQTATEPVSSSMMHATYDWGAQPATQPAQPVAQPSPSSPTEARPQHAQPAAPAPQTATPAQKPAPAEAGERLPIRGPALRIAENMEASLAVPTATSQRQIPIKLLDENRRIINQHLAAQKRKVSYTHLIAYAIIKALRTFPQLNDSFDTRDGAAYRIRHTDVNFGVAVDVTKKDGSRSLLVPSIKGADKMTFRQLLDTYDDVVRRARASQLKVEDFQGTTISLTNPGTIGTTASNPRLMQGQGVIVATGAIEYPPEYQAMSPESLSRIGISKIITLTSTYDHRIVQGAESGAFLARIDEMLRGQHEFYDEIFRDLSIPYRPYRWAVDVNPAILGEERRRDVVHKQARVFELINAYRVRGHLIANIDPIGWGEVQYHPELDIETYGLTIWDLDRYFITPGLGATEPAPLRQLLDYLHRYYRRPLARQL